MICHACNNAFQIEGFISRTSEWMIELARVPLQVFRWRQGPGGDHGVHQRSPRLDRAQMPRAFNTLVKPNMEVRRLPPRKSPALPARTAAPVSIDGKIPGRFWINLRTTDLHSKYSLADLTFHEAIPGHIWQGEYTHQMPLIRQLLSFNAYSEGWGLYAEQLADELGAYENDRSGGSDICSRLPSGRAGWSSTPASTPSAGPGNRACSSSSTSTDRTPRRSPARSTATAPGRDRRAATRWATARSIGSARRRRRHWDRN